MIDGISSDIIVHLLIVQDVFAFSDALCQLHSSSNRVFPNGSLMRKNKSVDSFKDSGCDIFGISAVSA